MKVYISTSRAGSPSKLKEYVKVLKGSYPEFKTEFKNFAVDMSGVNLDDDSVIEAIVKTLGGKLLSDKQELKVLNRLGFKGNDQEEIFEEWFDTFDFYLHVFKNKDGEFFILSDGEGLLLTTEPNFVRTHKRSLP